MGEVSICFFLRLRLGFEEGGFESDVSGFETMLLEAEEEEEVGERFKGEEVEMDSKSRSRWELHRTC